MEERKLIEADFHDRRARDKQAASLREFESKYPNKKLYAVTRDHRKRIDAWIAQWCPGSVALDFCCGEGEGAIKMSKAGADVHGIDISADSLATATESARHLTKPPAFKVMDAENLEFPDNYFDVVYAAGCFHHLDLSKTYQELHRVLKPGGRVMCNESLAHNPVFHFYRRKTPHLRTPWEVPHILRVADVMRAGEFFGKIDIRYHYLFSLAAVPLRRTALFNTVLSILEKVDRLVLSVPGVQRMAWQCTFELSLPKKK